MKGENVLSDENKVPAKVFVLWHVHEIAVGTDDAKLIGIYPSEDAARAAARRLEGQPGFRDHPDAFEISEYEVGRDHWTEGYGNPTD